MPTTLSAFVKSDIKVDIVDNNVSKGEDTVETAMIILSPEQDQQIVILNELGMHNLIKKTYINENAKSPLEVYPEGLDIKLSDIEQYFSPLGIKLIFESHQSIGNAF